MGGTPDMPRLDMVENGIVVPLFRYFPPKVDLKQKSVVPGSFDGGVYDAAGRRQEIGDNCFLSHENVGPEEIEPASAETELPGTWLYLGLLQTHHFGHFVSESLSRFWAVDKAEGIDGVIYIGRYPNQPLRPYIAQIADWLAPGLPQHRVNARTRVERLIVPRAMRFPQGYLSGEGPNRAFFRDRVDALGPPEAPQPKRVFLSRSALPREDQQARFVLEKAFDDNLAAEGWTVVHPQTMPIRDQLRLYRDADDLIFAEGSAFHLYVLAARSGQRVFNLWRRKRRHPVFARQLDSFAGLPLLGESHVTHMFMRRDAPNMPARALSLVDFAALGADLESHGLITGRKWRVPTKAQIRRDIAEQSREFDTAHPV
ncbi:hypothetical protein Ga0609869_000571 [Rhodovulum iodosum]|uniref:Glycosyltransferase 61 catalytic domain-containing protein n=1 Tax=Rhodovulum iodosum TaxID=68291 RepID=A0ABV3XPH2_9RHOB|nr:glycosyltransferase 61 family protein [Rhodovulum robiginosum]RSK31489.1 glycosyltransferase family 61 protein [Rhodovulum robiginosum]